MGRLISLVNFHEMALQFIWWRDILKDPLFEPLQAKFQPERMHNSRLAVIWSKLSQSLQNTRWRRQWLPHLTRIFSHWAKFLSLGTERSHTGPNPENRVEESIHSPIRSFVIATVDLWDDALSCWNLAWRGSKSKSFEMSCHQMDYSAISWKFTKLIKRLTYVYIYKYVCAC